MVGRHTCCKKVASTVDALTGESTGHMNSVRQGTKVQWTAGEREWSPCGMDERQLCCTAQSGSCCVDNPVRSDCCGHRVADRVENPGHATAHRKG